MYAHVPTTVVQFQSYSYAYVTAFFVIGNRTPDGLLNKGLLAGRIKISASNGDLLDGMGDLVNNDLVAMELNAPEMESQLPPLEAPSAFAGCISQFSETPTFINPATIDHSTPLCGGRPPYLHQETWRIEESADVQCKPKR